ncbi:MAG: hypothetical protein ABGX27_08520 [Desulfurobacteriaceae bacterium]
MESKLDKFYREDFSQLYELFDREEKERNKTIEALISSKKELDSLYKHRFFFMPASEIPTWFEYMKSYVHKLLNSSNLKIEDGVLIKQLNSFSIDTNQYKKLVDENLQKYSFSILLMIPILFYLNKYLLLHGHFTIFLVINAILYFFNLQSPPLRKLVFWMFTLTFLAFHFPPTSNSENFLIKKTFEYWENLSIAYKVVSLIGISIIYAIISAFREAKYDALSLKYQLLYNWFRELKEKING